MNRPADIPECIWFEEGHDLIRSCAALSSALGMQKSFSTSDVAQIVFPEVNLNLRSAVSELALNSLQKCGYLLENPRLERTSRSCSTWVAVGELASTSQLPSPHGGQTNPPPMNTSTPPPPAFTAADLIRSVNKKVRQNYIRKRLLTTYRALERLSQSEFNLDRLEAAAVAANSNSIVAGPGPTELIVPTYTPPVKTSQPATTVATTSSTSQDVSVSKCHPVIEVVNEKSSTSNQQQQAHNISPGTQIKKKIAINLNKHMTFLDIERERGKPLSKYERNMMIFNWLHSLDENSVVEDVP